MTDTKYYPEKIESKWQKVWEEKSIFSPDIKNAKNPYFNLMMFPYPSAEGLHVGNMYAFTGADVYAKFQRMQGKDVLEPIGLDGFGIHSENYALKVGRNPNEQAKIAEKNFYRQLRSIGNSFDWQRTVETYNPNYYKWTQWLFVTMFKNGLAYRKTALVNWCPKDLTVLSDEQVIDGSCERCGAKVEKKDLEQWFFRITKYADRLLDNIKDLNWTEKVRIAQKNWIGKKEGINITYKIEGLDDEITVFTTRPDTNFGATFIALAPENPLSLKIVTDEYREEVERYILEAKNKTDQEREVEGKEKTGVFTGRFAINQLTKYKMPIWVSDFVLGGFGTGALVGVPGHDKRDFEFAKKFGLEVLRVVAGKDGETSEIKSIDQVQEDEGKMINSQFLDGLNIHEATKKIMDYMEEKGFGRRQNTYHLRDWLISRQRYWGPPIPMIFCENCKKSNKGENSQMPGWFTVSEKNLPVMLPDVEDWKPEGTGKSPLANHPEFYKTTCPSCSGEAVRETDVSDTFLDSSWYFLRYPSTDIENAPFDIEVTRKWLPVNQYIGGAEHSVLHLLYSRFVTMVLHDLKYIDFDEPFSNFFAHGLIIKDGAKMSKSKGNVVVPDEYIEKYGADTLRTYLMFIGPYSDGGDFRDSGIEGMYKFLRKVWKLLSNYESEPSNLSIGRAKIMNKTVKKVTEDIAKFDYNTAIASLMEWYNYLNHDLRDGKSELNMEERGVFLHLLAPFAPHMAEELWQAGDARSDKAQFHSIHLSRWPEYDEKYLVSDRIIIPIQVNGKRRGQIEISNQDKDNSKQVEDKAREAVEKSLNGAEIKKVVYIPGKIINLVV